MPLSIRRASGSSMRTLLTWGTHRRRSSGIAPIWSSKSCATSPSPATSPQPPCGVCLRQCSSAVASGSRPWWQLLGRRAQARKGSATSAWRSCWTATLSALWPAGTSSIRAVPCAGLCRPRPAQLAEQKY
eukprot:scaffold991_cov227-Pinguiococcus_pyrenoidosus.AAC.5